MEKTINSNLQSMEERGEYAEYAVKTKIIESNCALGDMPLPFSDYRIELKPTEDKFRLSDISSCNEVTSN
jgi:hypothetical protein